MAGGDAMKRTVLGWWFAEKDELPHGDGRPVVIGEKLTVEPPIELCKKGLHASREIMQALKYATGSLLFRVRLSGEILEDEDKLAATERTALSRVDLEKTFRLFAADCAERALKRERKKGREPDARSWAAIVAARDFAEGKITKQDLDAAWKAAKAAARGAARDAALDAAWEAARDDAWDAAWDAAWEAAREAAMEAARGSAWEAAREAEQKWQERHLLAMIRAARRAGGAG